MFNRVPTGAPHDEPWCVTIDVVAILSDFGHTGSFVGSNRDAYVYTWAIKGIYSG